MASRMTLNLNTKITWMNDRKQSMFVLRGNVTVNKLKYYKNNTVHF